MPNKYTLDFTAPIDITLRVNDKVISIGPGPYVPSADQLRYLVGKTVRVTRVVSVMDAYCVHLEEVEVEKRCWCGKPVNTKDMDCATFNLCKDHAADA